MSKLDKQSGSELVPFSGAYGDRFVCKDFSGNSKVAVGTAIAEFGGFIRMKLKVEYPVDRQIVDSVLARVGINRTALNEVLRLLDVDECVFRVENGGINHGDSDQNSCVIPTADLLNNSPELLVAKLNSDFTEALKASNESKEMKYLLDWLIHMLLYAVGSGVFNPLVAGAVLVLYNVVVLEHEKKQNVRYPFLPGSIIRSRLSQMRYELPFGLIEAPEE